MSIKAIIFDFDGVVVNSEPLYVAAETRLFAQCGMTVPEEDWKYFKGTTENDFYEMIKTKYGINKTEELIAAGRQYVKDEFRKGLDYFPGFREFWQKIAGRHRTALVTSTSATFLSWIFENTNVRNRFDLTITADDVKKAKPHPEPYLLAMRRLHVEPIETIIIEDSINGIAAAVASGAITIGFLSGMKATDLPRADYYAKNYIEIGAILERLQKN